MPVSLQVSSMFGFHNARTGAVFQTLDRDGSDVPAYYKRVNVINVVGYLGPLGILTGIARLKGMQADMKMVGFEGMRSATIGRAVVEILCLGILLFIVDIIVSLGRHLCGCCPLRDKRGRPLLLES